MAVPVFLTFELPAQPDIALLRVWESDTSTGTFTQIDETSEVGSYPNYITHYTTMLAGAIDHWFAIQWVDEKGAASDLSEPWKGGVGSLVDVLMGRVLQRDTSLPAPVVIQEAEAAIEGYFGIDPYTADIYTLDDGKRYQVLSGLTYLVLARATLNEWVRSADADSVTIGMVTMKSSGAGSSSLKKVDELLALANGLLGTSTSVVMLMEDVQIGVNSLSSFDQSRLIGWVGLQ